MRWTALLWIGCGGRHPGSVLTAYSHALIPRSLTFYVTLPMSHVAMNSVIINQTFLLAGSLQHLRRPRVLKGLFTLFLSCSQLPLRPSGGRFYPLRSRNLFVGLKKKNSQLTLTSIMKLNMVGGVVQNIHFYCF